MRATATISHMSGSLNKKLVVPGGNEGAAFKKAVRTVEKPPCQCQHFCSFPSQQTRRLTLLVGVGRVVETPGLMDKGAQVGIGWVVLPEGPVGRPGETAIQSAQPGISIRVHDPTTFQSAGGGPFGGAMLVDTIVWLSVGEGGEGGQG